MDPKLKQLIDSVLDFWQEAQYLERPNVPTDDDDEYENVFEETPACVDLARKFLAEEETRRATVIEKLEKLKGFPHRHGCAAFNDLNPIGTPCNCGVAKLKLEVDEIIAFLSTE
jgi:hypothetical protein